MAGHATDALLGWIAEVAPLGKRVRYLEDLADGLILSAACVRYGLDAEGVLMEKSHGSDDSGQDEGEENDDHCQTAGAKLATVATVLNGLPKAGNIDVDKARVGDLATLETLLRTTLLAAVSGPRKEEAVQNILALPGEDQAQLALLMQQLLHQQQPEASDAGGLSAPAASSRQRTASPPMVADARRRCGQIAGDPEDPGRRSLGARRSLRRSNQKVQLSPSCGRFYARSNQRRELDLSPRRSTYRGDPKFAGRRSYPALIDLDDPEARNHIHMEENYIVAELNLYSQEYAEAIEACESGQKELADVMKFLYQEADLVTEAETKFVSTRSETRRCSDHVIHLRDELRIEEGAAKHDNSGFLELQQRVEREGKIIRDMRFREADLESELRRCEVRMVDSQCWRKRACQARFLDLQGQIQLEAHEILDVHDYYKQEEDAVHAWRPELLAAEVSHAENNEELEQHRQYCEAVGSVVAKTEEEIDSYYDAYQELKHGGLDYLRSEVARQQEETDELQQRLAETLANLPQLEEQHHLAEAIREGKEQGFAHVRESELQLEGRIREERERRQALTSEHQNMHRRLGALRVERLNIERELKNIVSANISAAAAEAAAATAAEAQWRHEEGRLELELAHELGSCDALEGRIRSVEGDVSVEEQRFECAELQAQSEASMEEAGTEAMVSNVVEESSNSPTQAGAAGKASAQERTVVGAKATGKAERDDGAPEFVDHALCANLAMEAAIDSVEPPVAATTAAEATKEAKNDGGTSHAVIATAMARDEVLPSVGVGKSVAETPSVAGACPPPLTASREGQGAPMNTRQRSGSEQATKEQEAAKNMLQMLRQEEDSIESEMAQEAARTREIEAEIHDAENLGDQQESRLEVEEICARHEAEAECLQAAIEQESRLEAEEICARHEAEAECLQAAICAQKMRLHELTSEHEERKRRRDACKKDGDRQRKEGQDARRATQDKSSHAEAEQASVVEAEQFVTPKENGSSKRRDPTRQRVVGGRERSESKGSFDKETVRDEQSREGRRTSKEQGRPDSMLSAYTTYAAELCEQVELRDRELAFHESKAADAQSYHDLEMRLLASALHRLGMKYGRLLSRHDALMRRKQKLDRPGSSGDGSRDGHVDGEGRR